MHTHTGLVQYTVYFYYTMVLRFWGMLSYLANTVIFILVGVVISLRAFSGVSSIDWIFLAVLYGGIMIIRYSTFMLMMS